MAIDHVYFILKVRNSLYVIDGLLADKGLPINSFGNFYVHDLLSLLVAKSYLGMGIAAFAAVGNLGSHVSDI